VDDLGVAPDRLLAAADRLRHAAAEWGALPVGGELVRIWPAHRRMVAPARTTARTRGPRRPLARAVR
jgi:hypothetical protein